MPRFCVNIVEQANGDHEVHDVSSPRDCHPRLQHQLDLGYHSTCGAAMVAAKAHYADVDGCRWCAPACHTS